MGQKRKPWLARLVMALLRKQRERSKMWYGALPHHYSTRGGNMFGPDGEPKKGRTKSRGRRF
jgi:hypothetical protein